MSYEKTFTSEFHSKIDHVAGSEFTTWDVIVKLVRDPFAAPILSALVIGIGTLIAKIILNRDIAKGTIKINQATEHAKFEIQRAHLLAEIRTQHLLEIYPKLNSAAHAAAGPFVTYFMTISEQIEKLRSQSKEPDEKQIQQLFADYWNAVSSPNGFVDANAILTFNNALADAKLFISEEVDAIAEEMKTEIMKLLRLIRREIENGTYKKYSKEQLLELLNKAHLSVSFLAQNKDHLARRMNKDLTPSI